MTLTEFLLARIAEDEASARDAESADISTVEHEHMARWSPERVLAECEAKRRIVNDWLVGVSLRDERGRSAYLSTPALDVCLKSHYRWLRLLALPYADHPDYRPEWRP